MKIPDGGKPIKVGDQSFIYKGVYHPIVWMGEDPYRPRVEMLVLKDAHYVYLRLKDGIDKMPPDKRNHSYTIPGGSIDADSSHLEQAIAETNEEALMKVCLVYHSGIQYYEMYEPGFVLKGGDMPIEYVGSMSEVYVGVYDGPYDKSKIEEKDLDNDMAENGRFYKIGDVAKYLRNEHIDALLRSRFVAESEKINLRLYRMDTINEATVDHVSPITVPNDKNELYHGSTYEIREFVPMSLDLGNVYEGPGWSTFCFASYDYAKMFGAARALTKLLEETYDGDGDIDELRVEFSHGYLIISEKCFNYIVEHDLMDMNATFYVYTIDASVLSVGIGNDPSLKEYTFRESNVIPKQTDRFDMSFGTLKELIEITEMNIDDFVHPTESEYAKLQTHNYRKEVEVRKRLEAAIKDGSLKPGDDVQKYIEDHNIEWNSDDIAIPQLSIDPDEVVFETVNLNNVQSVMEKKYPDDCYGLPDRKAYPMPDEKHVRSAIRFFNYVKSKEEEKELAKNINKKIRKFHITGINVGEKNRFKKYFKPIAENFSVKEFVSKMEEVSKIITAPEDSYSVKVRYQAYGKGKILVQSLLTHAGNGTLMDLDDTMDIGHLVNSAYAALAEINANQMELLPMLEMKTIRTLDLKVLLEAGEDDEEEETATDYTKMADDAETGDDDDAGDDTGDDAGDDDTGDEDNGEEEEATDYTEMADDAGAEGDDDDSDTGDDDTSSDDTSSEEDDNGEESDNNSNAYNNKELKNYFLLNSFLSLHQTVNDVLDTVNGVILPTPEANSIMVKVVKNLQDVKSFIEKFIQFQFSDSDYAFNLYYYNILISALRMNLELYQTSVSMGDSTKNKEKEE